MYERRGSAFCGWSLKRPGKKSPEACGPRRGGRCVSTASTRASHRSDALSAVVLRHCISSPLAAEYDDPRRATTRIVPCSQVWRPRQVQRVWPKRVAGGLSTPALTSNVGEVGFAVSPRAGLSAMSTSCCWTARISFQQPNWVQHGPQLLHSASHLLARPWVRHQLTRRWVGPAKPPI
jgi:hypothetical protein